MPTIHAIEVRCLNCAQWFKSPIQFGTTEEFSTTALFGNRAQCQHCHQLTACNAENFRIRSDDGGFIGNDTVL